MNYSYRVNPVYKAWKEFDYAIYDMIKRYNYSDVQDALQQSYIEFEKLYKKYNPDKDMKFKSWIITYLSQKLSRYCYENDKIYHRPIWTYKHKELIPITDVVSLDRTNIDGDNIVDVADNSIDLDYDINYSTLEKFVRKILNSIPEKYAKVIRDRWGIGTRQKLYREIALDLGCSIEYARQLYDRGIKYIKSRIISHPEYNIGDLLDYEA